MDDIEASMNMNPASEEELPKERCGIFPEISQRPVSLGRKRVPKYRNSVYLFKPCFIATPRGAYDGDLVAGLPEGGRLLPYASIDWHRQVLNNDQDPASIVP